MSETEPEFLYIAGRTEEVPREDGGSVLDIDMATNIGQDVFMEVADGHPEFVVDSYDNGRVHAHIDNPRPPKNKSRASFGAWNSSWVPEPVRDDEGRIILN